MGGQYQQGYTRGKQIPIHSCSVWSDVKLVLLNTTIQYHLKKYESSHKDLVDKLLHSIYYYVDDIVSEAQDNEEALLMYKQSKNLFKAEGFNLRMFVTNGRHLQEKFDQEEGIANTTENITGSDETYTSSTLGTTQITIVGEQKVLEIR